MDWYAENTRKTLHIAQLGVFALNVLIAFERCGTVRGTSTLQPKKLCTSKDCFTCFRRPQEACISRIRGNVQM